MAEHDVIGRLAEVFAAGAPLQVIVGGVLASQADSSNLPEASRTACNLIATSKDFQHAVQSCQGLIPAKFGPPASPEAVAAFAAWLSKHGRVLNKLELTLKDHEQMGNADNLSPQQQAAAEQAIAAALQEAAAATPGYAGGLHITSCKLECRQPDSAAILQALPGSILTSLVYNISFPDAAPAEDIVASLSRVAQALAGLQQLRYLNLQSRLECCADVCCGPALLGCSAMTQLTRLHLSKVDSDQGLRHLPPSLLELCCELPDAAYSEELRMGQLTSVTKLEFSEWNALASHHILPPNTQELMVGSMEGTGCLLPLTQLRELTMLGSEAIVTPAAELHQLSSLTSLTYIDLIYIAGGENIGTAADGWGDLQLRRLHIWPYGMWDQCLTRNTLLALSRLTGLRSLVLAHCDLDTLQPAELGAVLGQLTSLESLTLDRVRLEQQQQQPPPQPQEQQQQQLDSVSLDEEEESSASNDESESSSEDNNDDAQATAAAATEGPLAALLHSLAARMHRMELTIVSITGQHVDRAAAAALAGFVGLQELQLASCQLEDCSVIDIALGLQHSLRTFGVPGSRGVTDACLPVLRHLPRLKALNLVGTGVTRQGKQRYLPQRLWGCR